MSINDQELDQRLAALPRQTEVNPDIWTAVARRIERPQKPWLHTSMAAASALAVIGLLWLLVEPTGRIMIDAESHLVAAEVKAMRRHAPEAVWVDSAAPELLESLDQAWAENEVVIAELEAALQRHPGNTQLLDLLARARLRQSELLNHAMAGNGPTQPPTRSI